MELREILSKLDRDIQWLSKEADIPYSTLNDLINGRVNIKKCYAANLTKIGKVLGISKEKLINIILGEDEYEVEYYYRQKLLEASIPSIGSLGEDAVSALLYLEIKKMCERTPFTDNEIHCLLDKIENNSEFTEMKYFYRIKNHIGLMIEEQLDIVELRKKVRERKKTKCEELSQEEVFERVRQYNYSHRKSGVSLRKLHKYYEGLEDIEEMPICELISYATALGKSLDETYDIFLQNMPHNNCHIDKLKKGEQFTLINY